MPEPAEFVALAGPGIQILWSETHDAICLTIRYLPDSHASVQKTAHVNNDSSCIWTCSERSEREAKVVTFRAHDGQQSNLPDENAKKFEESTQKLKEKVRGKWEKKLNDVKANQELWIRNPSAFFRKPTRCSSERWSFEELRDSGERDPDRIPFHKLNLAIHFNKRMDLCKQSQPDAYFLESSTKKAMIAENYSGFDNLDRGEQRSVTRTFENHIKQGETLKLIMDLRAGLLLIIAQFLTREDCKLIALHLNRSSESWLTPEIKTRAAECDQAALAILEYMQEKSEAVDALTEVDGVDVSAVTPLNGYANTHTYPSSRRFGNYQHTSEIFLTGDPSTGQASQTARGFHYPPERIFHHVPIIIPYDSPIFVCVQKGDIDGTRRLLTSGMASIDVVDPYGLGLLYYATYYCWRSAGPAAAFAICRALLDIGANPNWVDEIGNTPMETMIDDVLVTWAMENNQQHDFRPSALNEIARLFGKGPSELWREYRDSRQFTTLHDVLLGIDRSYGTLEDYLTSLAATGLLTDMIDATDSRGRSALAWAVEYNWADAVKILAKFGADVHQRRPSAYGGSPLLHLAIAGPAPLRPESRLLDVIRILIQMGIDINSIDHELWTPLHIAASWNLYDVLITLAQFGGGALNWRAVTSSGQSALDLALGGGGDVAVLDLLHKRSCNGGCAICVNT